MASLQNRRWHDEVSSWSGDYLFWYELFKFEDSGCEIDIEAQQQQQQRKGKQENFSVQKAKTNGGEGDLKID